MADPIVGKLDEAFASKDAIKVKSSLKVSASLRLI